MVLELLGSLDWLIVGGEAANETMEGPSPREEVPPLRTVGEIDVDRLFFQNLPVVTPSGPVRDCARRGQEPCHA